MTATTTTFDIARLDGANLEYRVQGDGEPVLLIHGAIVSDAFGPMMAEPALADGYRLIQYHRRGFDGSSRATSPFSIAGQATDARALLDYLGIERAHVVGHSYGGAIALQLTLDAPKRVHSLALLEPALLNVPSAGPFAEGLGPIIGRYQDGDAAGAMEGFLEAVAGPGLGPVIDDRIGSDWHQRAVADIDTFFSVEFPALGEWSFTREQAGSIHQPVLSVLGAQSAAVTPMTGEVHALLQEWLPQTEPVILPDATHALQMMNPRGMAQALSGFMGRHQLHGADGQE